eukprot:5575426-Heterocapsa_arctica.AAC.1
MASGPYRILLQCPAAVAHLLTARAGAGAPGGGEGRVRAARITQPPRGFGGFDPRTIGNQVRRSNH